MTVRGLYPPERGEDGAHLVRLNRALAVLGACTEAVVHATDEAALLDEICRIIVDVSGYRMAWIGWAEEDPERSVRPAAQAGMEAGYLLTADVHWSDSPRGRGPSGTAIRLGRPIRIRDVHSDPAFAPWREEAVRRGYASVLGVPLRDGDRVAGSFTIYSDAPDAFDDDEVRLLERLGANLMHGLGSLRAERQRQEAEAQLRRTTEQLRALHAASPDMIFLHAADGHLLEVNEKAVARYGIPREEFLAQGPEALIGGGHTAEEALAHVARAVAGEAVDFEWVARGADGEFPVEVRLRRLDFDGGPDPDALGPRVVAVVRDLTEQKRAEAERLRTQRLESLGVLAGGIAHDFNNFLTGILGHVSLASTHADRPDEVRTLLASAERACLRAQDLTRQLLTFAKGGAPLRRPLDLRREAASAARFALRGRAVQLLLELPEDLWRVEADAGQVAQAVQNLVMNADQAMGGEGRVRLVGANVVLTGTESLPLPPGRYVRLSVIDEGPGVSAEAMPHLFDPYFTTKKGGTGLGLATTFSIMKGHGGHATVSPDTDRGARFDLWFPAGPEPVEAAPAPTASFEAGPPGRILVMDDDPQVRDAALAILASGGHRTEGVATGEEALEAWRAAAEAEDPFDVVVLDLTVPGGLGGARVLEALRARNPEVRAIVCSGYSDAPVISEWRRHGFAGAVAKPYRARDLLGEVARVLAEGRDGRR